MAGQSVLDNDLDENSHLHGNGSDHDPSKSPLRATSHDQILSLAQDIDPDAEKRLVRKLDIHLLSMVFVTYLLSYLDRSNIGNAKIAGMQDDLHLSASGSDYSWLLTIFYIGYIVFEWFSLCWKIFPPNVWAAAMVFLWGLVATLQACTQNWAGMMALRFFLGVFEGGFSPGVTYYLSFFYRRRELGLRFGIYLSAGPLASCFAGALAYGITSGHPKLASWRLLFLVEGLPTVIMAFFVYFFLPPSVEQARFLNEQDKLIGRARTLKQVGNTETGKDAAQVHSYNRIGSVNMKELGEALLDIKNWITGLMYFSCNVSFSSLPVFLPTIISEMGFSDINAQGLSAPPNLFAFLFTILFAYISDRTGQRNLVIIGMSLFGAAGYIMLATTTSVGARYAGCFLAAAGSFPSIINILALVLNNQGSDSKRGMGVVMLNTIGQCGPLLGTRLYPAGDAPLYRKGMWTCAAFMLFNGLLAVVMRTLLVRENKRRDREASGESGGIGEENEGEGFRYIL